MAHHRIAKAGEAFVITRDDSVIGTIEQINKTLWTFFPVVDGKSLKARMPLPLHEAIEAAIDFQPT